MCLLLLANAAVASHTLQQVCVFLCSAVSHFDLCIPTEEQVHSRPLYGM